MVQTRRRIDPRRREIKTNYEGKQRWEMKEEGHRLTILMSPLPTLNSSQDQTTTSAHSDWPTPISQRPTFVLPPFHFLLLPIEKELNYTKGKRRENNARRRWEEGKSTRRGSGKWNPKWKRKRNGEKGFRSWSETLLVIPLHCRCCCCCWWFAFAFLSQSVARTLTRTRTAVWFLSRLLSTDPFRWFQSCLRLQALHDPDSIWHTLSWFHRVARQCLLW